MKQRLLPSGVERTPEGCHVGHFKGSYRSNPKKTWGSATQNLSVINRLKKALKWIPFVGVLYIGDNQRVEVNRLNIAWHLFWTALLFMFTCSSCFATYRSHYPTRHRIEHRYNTPVHRNNHKSKSAIWPSGPFN